MQAQVLRLEPRAGLNLWRAAGWQGLIWHAAQNKPAGDRDRQQAWGCASAIVMQDMCVGGCSMPPVSVSAACAQWTRSIGCLKMRGLRHTPSQAPAVAEFGTGRNLTVVDIKVQESHSLHTCTRHALNTVACSREHLIHAGVQFHAAYLGCRDRACCRNAAACSRAFLSLGFPLKPRPKQNRQTRCQACANAPSVQPDPTLLQNSVPEIPKQLR